MPGRIHTIAWAYVLAMVLGAAPLLATHYVVDPGGGGDFTTIQAAIDQLGVVPRDTILVMPGEFPDTLMVPRLLRRVYIIGTSGPGATRVGTVRFLADWYRTEQTRFEGLTFTGDMSQIRSERFCYFAQCSFLGTVFAHGEAIQGNFYDCDFYGRTMLVSYPDRSSPALRNLRFHGAPLVVSTWSDGRFSMVNCSFEGPADTLVLVEGSDDPVEFRGCRFVNAQRGIVYRYLRGLGEVVERCSFEDLNLSGISCTDATGTWSRDQISITDSRFERCGTAIHWLDPGSSPRSASGLTLDRDTILASGRYGVRVGHNGVTIRRTIIAGGSGHGLAIEQELPTPDSPGDPTFVDVSESSFLNNGEDGMVVDARNRSWERQNAGNYPVRACAFAFNGGAGLRVTVPQWDVRDCVSHTNGGDGFSLTMDIPGRTSRTLSNTSVANGGDGFRVIAPTFSGDSALRIQRNLAAKNAGAGLSAPRVQFGSYAFNDAWANELGEHMAGVSPADSNLVVDPWFCDLDARDLQLQKGSRCGVSGVYGLIGALPESCPTTVGVGPPIAGALAFAVRPSVARGVVEFVPPAAGAEGVVELFDLAGRVVWRAPLGPATGIVRWRGEGEAGRTPAGLYWVRFSRGSERATRRLVWLE